MGYNEVLFEQLSEERQLLKATNKRVSRVRSQIETQKPCLQTDLPHHYNFTPLLREAADK